MLANTSKEARWVMTRYAGEQAKHVNGMAGHGIGYYVLDRPANGSAWIEVAFLWPVTGPVPDHLTEVSSAKLLDQLENWHHER